MRKFSLFLYDSLFLVAFSNHSWKHDDDDLAGEKDASIMIFLCEYDIYTWRGQNWMQHPYGGDDPIIYCKKKMTNLSNPR